MIVYGIQIPPTVLIAYFYGEGKKFPAGSCNSRRSLPGKSVDSIGAGGGPADRIAYTGYRVCNSPERECGRGNYDKVTR